MPRMGHAAVCKLALATAVLALAPAALAPASTLDQFQADTSTYSNVAGPRGGPGVTQSLAQTFTARISGTLEGVELNLSKDTAGEPLVVELRAAGSDGAPGATVLAQTYLGAEQVSETGAWLALGLSAPVTAGTAYAIVAYTSGGSVYQWNSANTDSYSGGQGFFQPASPPGATWTMSVGDRAFRTYLAATGTVLQFIDPGCSTWTAPPGVRNVRALATGAAGAAVIAPPSGLPLPDGVGPAQSAPGGSGDAMTATIAGLAPAQQLRVCVNVGGGGRNGSGGPGGGASGVALGPDFSTPVVIGGGGGASAQPQSLIGAAAGGNAGWPAGADGQGPEPGRGGTQSGPGAAGADGEGPGAPTTAAGPGGGGTGAGVYSGGGGGGWFGGGGGGDLNSIIRLGGGGGGGSDYCAAFASLCSRTPGGSGTVGVTLTYTAAAPTIARPTGAPFGERPQGAPLAVSSFTQSARRWRASRSARRKGPVGTTFRFALNRAAKATLTFYRASTERRLGALTRTAPSGASRMRFTGRVSARLRLRAGRYTVILRATDGITRVAAKRLTFTIVR